MKKIEKAMKKPQFQELLGDYMMEISDPKNKDVFLNLFRNTMNI